MRRILFATLLTLAGGGSAFGQPLDVPFDTYCPPDAQAACFGAAEVMGLNPTGDGFLAVRSGPGSDYRKIGEVRNGDRVGVYERRGDWHAITFGPGDRPGWAHGNWLGNFIP